MLQRLEAGLWLDQIPRNPDFGDKTGARQGSVPNRTWEETLCGVAANSRLQLEETERVQTRQERKTERSTERKTERKTDRKGLTTNVR
jgi:hypothetical protein